MKATWGTRPVEAGEGKRPRQDGDVDGRPEDAEKAAAIRSAEWRLELSEVPRISPSRVETLVKRLDELDADFHDITSAEWPGENHEWVGVVRRRNLYYLAVALVQYEEPPIGEREAAAIAMAESPDDPDAAAEIITAFRESSYRGIQNARKRFFNSATPLDIKALDEDDNPLLALDSGLKSTMRSLTNARINKAVASISGDRLERLKALKTGHETSPAVAMFWGRPTKEHALAMYEDVEYLWRQMGGPARECHMEITPRASLLAQMDHAVALWAILPADIKEFMIGWKSMEFGRLRQPFKKGVKIEDYRRDTENLAQSIIVNELCHLGRLDQRRRRPLIVYHGMENAINPFYEDSIKIYPNARSTLSTFVSCSFAAKTGLIDFGVTSDSDSLALELDDSVPFFDYNFSNNEILKGGEREVILPASSRKVIDSDQPMYARVNAISKLYSELKTDRARCVEIINDLRKSRLQLHFTTSVENPLQDPSRNAKLIYIHSARCSTRFN